MFLRNKFERKHLKKKKNSATKIYRIAIIRVSNANADDKEKAIVCLKFGFLIKLIPV